MGGKYYAERSFSITPFISAVCRTQDTRYGFRHLCTLSVTGMEVGRSKSCYYNRTWEAFEYQTVIRQAIEGSSLSKTDSETALKWCESYRPGNPFLGSVAAVAALGSILGGTQKEANDWKSRMLKAGLSNSGLEMPDDWASLSEDEKQKRLDGAISVLAESNKV